MQQKTAGQVAVLMALFNGAPHLQAQLDSLARQGTDWRLWVGDDGSTDDGPQIVRDFAANQPKDRVELLTGQGLGPGQGPAQNFRRLLQRVPDKATAVAFCDQDDVWPDDKLSRASIRRMRWARPRAGSGSFARSIG
ncbi:glycosyltransferase [Paracoccus sp. DMF-8]|uniref:glycosyltransferase n=1 Tax=Paracoccus sp. DMF-8 TaxID=3019445 RepID=UPI0023E8A7A1|nr:glycosyltransferase [Paracoccus sp. DMF-8]MDF3605215.1 glycosyltransferase [Paracoccus sp. DMF-8]